MFGKICIQWRTPIKNLRIPLDEKINFVFLSVESESEDSDDEDGDEENELDQNGSESSDSESEDEEASEHEDIYSGDPSIHFNFK